MDYIANVFDGIKRNELLIPELEVRGAGSLEDRKRNVDYSVKETKNRVSAVPEHDGTFVIAGYGPSLKASLPFLIEEVKAGHTVLTTSGAHDFLISNGVIPDYHADMDPRSRKAEFVKTPHKDIHYLVASVCHPDFWRNLEGYRTTLWHLADMVEMQDYIARLEPDANVHPSAQCIGLTAIALGHSLGFRKFSLHGMDCSYSEGEPHAGPHNGSNSDEKRLKVRCGEKYFETRLEWIQYARNFNDHILPRMLNMPFRIYGEGLLQEMCKQKWMKDHGSSSPE